MTTALVVAGSPPRLVDLASELAAVGIHVVGATTCGNLVRDAAQWSPDVVVCHEISADNALFESFALLADTAPRPVVVFTHDPDAAKIAQAMRSGVHAYIINGYSEQRLRAVLQVARCRFDHERALRDQLADAMRRFDERKLVDRAKGILMRARQVSEEEAFAVLRTASMHSHQRVGQVSRHVIAAAHYADAVNRAGKLRMLAQRLVKLCAMRAMDPPTEGALDRIGESIAQIDGNIAALGKTLSKATFGDLLEAAEAAWPPLRALVLAPPTVTASAAHMIELDRRAEDLLGKAEQLTLHLENAGLVTTLHVINVSGRQRMWSQRYAKQALLGSMLTGEPARLARDDLRRTAQAFGDALSYLRGIPLSTREIRDRLSEADAAWAMLVQAGGSAQTAASRRALGESSEALLALFETLTDHYERSMQVLMG